MLRFKEYIQLLEVELSFDRKHPKLGEIETKLSTKLASDEEQVLRRYEGQSHYINPVLLKYHNNGIAPPSNIHTAVGAFNLPAIDSATNKPFNRSFTMYSGLGFDPRLQLKNNKLFLPAFTSGSLNKGTAGKYMKHIDENGFQHILRVNVKHNDNGVSLSSFTNRAHEIVLPRNTILHIHRSEIDPENPNVMVHHAIIDHETYPNDFQKPTRIDLINALMDKIHSNTHTGSDLGQAYIKGYLTQDHIDELSKQLLQKIKSRNYTTDDLEQASKFGYIKDIGQTAINSIANDPESIHAHDWLADAHQNGIIKIGQSAINSIANYPESTWAHASLAQAHQEGKDIGKTAIDAIANNPDSIWAHDWLASAHRDGKDIGKTAIDAIANNPNSTGAHRQLAQAHQNGMYIEQSAINAIANNPDSTWAHAILVEAHKKGKDIGEDNYNKILSYRN